MKMKKLWLIWLYLFCFCCVLGFIPEPPELAMLGACFFIPGALLLIKGGKKNVIRIRLISILSLVLTLAAIILNFSTVLMDSVWGTVCQILLGIVSTPMLCCQAWVISLFGWACLMAGSFFIKK